MTHRLKVAGLLQVKLRSGIVCNQSQARSKRHWPVRLLKEHGVFRVLPRVIGSTLPRTKSNMCDQSGCTNSAWKYASVYWCFESLKERNAAMLWKKVMSCRQCSSKRDKGADALMRCVFLSKINFALRHFFNDGVHVPLHTLKHKYILIFLDTLWSPIFNFVAL